MHASEQTAGGEAAVRRSEQRVGTDGGGGSRVSMEDFQRYLKGLFVVDIEPKEERKKKAEEAAKKAEEEEKEQGPPPKPHVGQPEMFAVGFMVVMFIITIAIAVFVSPTFKDMGMAAFTEEQGSNPLIAVLYLISLVCFTGVLLLIIKFRKLIILKFIVLGAVFGTMCYVFVPVMALVLYPIPEYDFNDAAGPAGEVTCVATADIWMDGDDEVLLGMDTGDVYIYDADSLEQVGMLAARHEGTWVENIHVVTGYTDVEGQHIIVSSLAPAANISYHSHYDLQLNFLEEQGSNLYESSVTLDHGIVVMRDDSLDIASWIYGVSSKSSGTQMTFDELRLEDPEFLDSYMDAILVRSNGTVRLIKISDTSTYSSDEVIPTDVQDAWITQVDDEGIQVLAQTEDTKLTLYDHQGDVLKERELEKVPDTIWFGDALEGLGGDELVYSSEGYILFRYSPGDADKVAFKTYYNMSYETGRSHDGIDDHILVCQYDSDKDSDYPVRVVTISASGGSNQLHSSKIPSLYFVFDLSPALFVGVLISGIITLILFLWPEWYVVNLCGILVGVGALGIIGISLSIAPIMLIMVLLAIYDAIAVYKTKHMLSLADAVLKLSLPIILVAPKTLKYSFRQEAGLTNRPKKVGARKAMFVGLGDIIIPGLLIVSSYTFLPHETFLGMPSNLLMAVGCFLGTMAGFSVLMYFVLKGNPQAGLPLLNGGTLVFYFLTYLIVYQDLSFGLTISSALPFPI